MYESAAKDANSTQAEQTNDLEAQIAAREARLAEQERLLDSARRRLNLQTDAELIAREQRHRRQELWARIVEQSTESYLDSGQLPDGSIVDLVLESHGDSPADSLLPNGTKTCFIRWTPPESESSDRQPQITCSDLITMRGHAWLPQQVDAKLLKSIRLPSEAAPYESLQQLISDISQLILRCVALSDTDARLLAHFVLSTWLIDRLPVAPYLALVGPPQSGKTTLLRVLHLLCRRSLFASDATSIALLHASNQLHPTLLIDETSSVEDPVALRRLLRIGNTPGSLVLRHKQSWNVFGAKVICWRELPDDAALNSRCIILPMHAVNDPALRLPDDPEIVSAAATLQSQLLYYRLANYNNIAIPNVIPKETSSPRKRELYFALAAPCVNDEDSHRFLLDYFRNNNLPTDDALTAAEHAVLVALFQSAHMQNQSGELLTKEVAERANRYLRDEREHINLAIRRVGAILTGFGFNKRRRLEKGWALPMEQDDRHRLHAVAQRYGVGSLGNETPALVRCSLCPDAPLTSKFDNLSARPFAAGIIVA